MTKKVLSILFLFTICLPVFVFAETIILKSGQKVEGKILEKTDKAVKIDFYGVPIKYNLEDIESIDGKSSDLTKMEPQSGESAVPVINKPLFSTAIVTYKYIGGRTGTEVLYVDAVNNRIDQEISTKIIFSGSPVSRDDRKMYDGKVFYVFRMKDNMAIKEDIKGSALSKIFNEASWSDYYTGEKEFLGRECKAYESTVSSCLVWNGIVLREEVTGNPLGENFNYIKEAVDIKLDAPIPEDKFTIPAGIKIMTTQEAVQSTQKMFKELGNKLKKYKR